MASAEPINANPKILELTDLPRRSPLSKLSASSSVSYPPTSLDSALSQTVYSSVLLEYEKDKVSDVNDVPELSDDDDGIEDAIDEQEIYGMLSKPRGVTKRKKSDRWRVSLTDNLGRFNCDHIRSRASVNTRPAGSSQQAGYHSCRWWSASTCVGWNHSYDYALQSGYLDWTGHQSSFAKMPSSSVQSRDKGQEGDPPERRPGQ